MTPKDLNNHSKQQGLPRARILRGKKRFEKLFSDGRVIHEKKIMLRYFLDDEAPTYNMAFIVAKRLGKAVDRNKIKRRMREVYRRNLYMLDALYGNRKNEIPGFYGAFMAKSVNLDYTQAESEIIKLLEKLKKKIQLNAKIQVE